MNIDKVCVLSCTILKLTVLRACMYVPEQISIPAQELLHMLSSQDILELASCITLWNLNTSLSSAAGPPGQLFHQCGCKTIQKLPLFGLQLLCYLPSSSFAALWATSEPSTIVIGDWPVRHFIQYLIQQMHCGLSIICLVHSMHHVGHFVFIKFRHSVLPVWRLWELFVMRCLPLARLH